MSTIFRAQPSPASPQHRTNSLARLLASYPLVPALVMLAVAVIARAQHTVDSDVSWQLWIGHHLNSGAVLYRDMVEVNPPLWFWMAMPVDRMASVMGLRAEAVLVVAIGILTLLSLLATNRLIPCRAPLARAAFATYAALILFVVPWLHTGQREQLLLIGTLPYAALIAARLDGRVVPTWLAVCVGAGAALGFALKHYFLIVPALLELWLFAARHRAWRPIRPETITIVAAGALYAAAIPVVTPGYLAEIVPMARLAYGVTGATDPMHLMKPGLVVGVITLAILGAHRRILARPDASFPSALIVAAVGFVAVYFVQAKGWVYHAIPLEGGAALALMAVVLIPAALPISLRLAAPALLALPLLVTAREVASDSGPSPDLLRAVSGLKPGESIGFLTEDAGPPWSVTLQRDFRYASRYNGFWMLRAIASNEAKSNPDPRVAELGRRAVGQIVTDFRCIAPRRIVIARPQPGTWNQDTIDILPYFQRDPAFDALLTHYSRSGGPSTYEVYKRTTMPQLPAGSECRRGF